MPSLIGLPAIQNPLLRQAEAKHMSLSEFTGERLPADALGMLHPKVVAAIERIAVICASVSSGYRVSRRSSASRPLPVAVAP